MRAERRHPTKDQAFIGPGTSNPVGNSTTISAAELKVRIEMNSATDWLVTWYFDGSQRIQSNHQSQHMPALLSHYVAFGGNGMFLPCYRHYQQLQIGGDTAGLEAKSGE